MTTSIIITICCLLLLAYLFDISASKTKIPSVISLLILGWAAKQLSTLFNISIPDLTPILPILGTVGLVLIVLEGSLELELNRSKFPLVAKSSIVALLPMLVLSLGLAYAFQYFGNSSFKIGLANAIPFAIISSAIAIPSAKNLMANHKEFITYESSLSDIFGVILFNFITLNDAITVAIAGHFVVDLLLTLIVTFVATILLAYLLSKIQQPVKFVPIILMLVLIYAIAKTYHLPALIFILLFGLFMGNLDELKHISFIQKLRPNILNKEVHRFKDLTTEIVFLVRALFFLLFGFLIDTKELLNADTLIWSLSIVAAIFLLRWLCLKVFNLQAQPLLFVAPRGLITILLFLSIPISQSNSIANKSLIIQVIILSAIVMMIGLMTNKKANT